jgi:uncharacterized repeat protein (TIGR01451 family)
LNCSWTCAAGAGSSCTAGPVNGDIADGNVTIDVGSSAVYTATCDIAADATGTLVNTATVASAGEATDPNTADNTATDSNTLDVTANLRIDKYSNITDMTMGGNVTYTIVATNDGPSHVTDANVVDNFNAPLLGCSWTSVSNGGASGNTNGSGAVLSDMLDMPVSSQVAYTVICGTDPNATDTTMSNTATIASALANESASGDNTSVAEIRMLIPMSVPTLSAWSLPLLALALASLVGLRSRRNNRRG